MEIKWMVFSMVAFGLIVYGALSVAFEGNLSSPNTNLPNTNPTPLVLANTNSETAAIANGVQKIALRATSTGTYSPAAITVKKGIPVELSFSADPRSGCGQQLVMKDFGVNVIVNAGQTKVISFTPQSTGTFEYACGMRMFRGKLTVTE